MKCILIFRVCLSKATLHNTKCYHYQHALVDLITGAYTQPIESNWSHLEIKILRHCTKPHKNCLHKKPTLPPTFRFFSAFLVLLFLFLSYHSSSGVINNYPLKLRPCLKMIYNLIFKRRWCTLIRPFKMT